MPGPRSITKQHPKDEWECYDTHSHNQDQKDAYYRIEHVGFSRILGVPNLITAISQSGNTYCPPGRALIAGLTQRAFEKSISKDGPITQKFKRDLPICALGHD